MSEPTKPDCELPESLKWELRNGRWVPVATRDIACDELLLLPLVVINHIPASDDFCRADSSNLGETWSEQA